MNDQHPAWKPGLNVPKPGNIIDIPILDPKAFTDVLESLIDYLEEPDEPVAPISTFSNASTISAKKQKFAKFKAIAETVIDAYTGEGESDAQ